MEFGIVYFPVVAIISHTVLRFLKIFKLLTYIRYTLKLLSRKNIHRTEHQPFNYKNVL
jgi:hypothetical protein